MREATPQNAADWHEIANLRVRDLRPRTVFCLLVAVGGALVGHGPWPWIWLAATVVAQLAVILVTAPARRDPAFRMTPRREGLYYLSLGLSSTIFALSGVMFWFDAGAPGRLFAVIVLVGGMMNVTLQAGASARQLWIACAPFVILLQTLPMISLAFAPSAERPVLTLTAFGATLVLLHLAAAAHRSVCDARSIQAALHEARRERLRAEAASAAKSDFLGVMSHELRTPLNGVLGMAQVMAGEGLSAAQRERLEVIRLSGESLLMLLNDLLDISKIETARLVLEPEVVDLTALAAQAQAVFGPLAEAKAIDLHVRLLESAGAARLGDPHRVRQVLHNLIGNAVKFTDEGGVAVAISGAGDQLVFEVSDTGQGVAAEQQALLFEQFSQSDPSATRRHGGSGLGLAIARGLARLMEGDVTLSSTPRQGSVFTARLTLPEVEAAALEPAVAPAGSVETRLRVLAAEDNPTNQLVIKTLLEQLGLSVHLVEDGEAAVQACHDAAWDLVLMDIQMPQMDGLAAARAIRAFEAAEGRPRTPIVAVTANATARQAAEYRDAGMDGLAPKPIQLAQLVAVIDEVTRLPVRRDEDVQPLSAA